MSWSPKKRKIIVQKVECLQIIRLVDNNEHKTKKNGYLNNSDGTSKTPYNRISFHNFFICLFIYCLCYLFFRAAGDSDEQQLRHQSTFTSGNGKQFILK